MKRFAMGLVLCWFGAASAAEGDEVTGAGASFPAPLYARWAADYHRATGARVNYQSIGSGAGVRQIEAGTVDFGASDVPLAQEELAAKALVQFPTVVGGIVPVVHVAGIAPGQLRLDGVVLADIYLGRITRWNDAAIAALNSDVPLPDAAIAVVRRADASGSTFVFSHYLSAVSEAWRGSVGTGTALNWPLGVGGKGNEGVAALVRRLPNAIGYVEFAHAKQGGLAWVQLRNREGAFVAPGAASFRAAAAGVDWGAGCAQMLTDQPGREAWPIASATFVLLRRLPEGSKGAQQAAAVLRFFSWAYSQGDVSAAALDYVALPQSVKEAVLQSWGEIRDAAGQPVVSSPSPPTPLPPSGRGE